MKAQLSSSAVRLPSSTEMLRSLWRSLLLPTSTRGTVAVPLSLMIFSLSTFTVSIDVREATEYTIT
jgi:hypothetical protein